MTWKIQDFNRVWTRELAIPVWRSNQLSYDEGLMLETSASQIFHGGNFTFINSFDKTKFLFRALPPTQHHSFFRN